MHRFHREGAERYVCELLGDNGRCGLIFTSWKKFIAHPTRNKGGNHGIKSPLRVAVITNQCVNGGSTFADRSTTQNHVGNSWSRGTCRTDGSHMTWSLKEVTEPITCNLCEQEFGDLQTDYAHARLTHLPFPAPTIKGCRHAQPLRQPRRNRQHARNGHKREPGGHQEGPQPGRRGAAKSKRDGGASGATTAVAKPTAKTSRSRRRASTNSCSRPSSRSIRRSETFPRRCGTPC